MIEVKRIFIDTSPFIYFIEGEGDIAIKARDMFLKYLNAGTEMITSIFTDIEYKILPKRNSEYGKIQAYDNIKEEFNINTISTSKVICDMVIDIRANNRSIKLVDAFQLAIAVKTNCDLFVTNDKDLTKFKCIKCILLDEY